MNAAETNGSFPAPFNTEPSKLPLTSPAEALAKIKAPPGFKLSLIAAEPTVQNPIGIATDERGRIWVAENYTYAEAPKHWETTLRDRIVVLDSSKHHGKFDKRTVFWDKGHKLTSVEVGFGGVWALCAPKLIFIPDKDGDLVPDGAPEVLLDGFNEFEVGHNVVNGLRWGPDGWLYGRHGIQATSAVGKPGTPMSERTKLNCCIWRYHPTRHVFEVVCNGTTNPWGMDWNEVGEAFFINTVIGHLWQVIPGAHYKRMYGEDLNPHVYDLIDQHADHYHWDTNSTWQASRTNSVKGSDLGGGHAHDGLLFYQGDRWPERYRDTIFMINLHGYRLNHDYLQRVGSGYVGHHTNDFLFFNDAWFRGVDLLASPDGGVYVADWTDTGECHEADGVHRTSGRIYDINYGSASAAKTGLGDKGFDLRKLSNQQLVQMQLDRNDWFVRQARRLLQERAAAGRDTADARAGLVQMFEKEKDVTRKLRAMWALWCIGGIDESWLMKELGHPSENVRVWAIRFLTEKRATDDTVLRRFARMAREDKSAMVRLALASALQRISVGQRAEIAANLLQHVEDENDHNLPLMLWYGIEPLAAEDPNGLAHLVENTGFSTVRRYAARRLTEDIEKRPEPINELLQVLAEHGSEGARRDLIEGMAEALRGWRKAPKPAAWDSASKSLLALSDPKARARALELGVVFGDGRASEELRRVTEDDTADPASRRTALQTLVQSRAPNLLPLVITLLANRDLAADAARALANFDDPSLASELVNNYSRFRDDVRPDIIATLSSRPAFARVLLQGVAAGKILRSDISAYTARQIQSLGDPEINRLLAQSWGEVRAAGSGEKKQQIAAWKAKLTPEFLKSANVQHGREVFLKTCGICHKLYGQGASIGPELTGSGRQNLDYLLENVVDPSAIVPADYKLSIVQMKDDRTINGMIREEKEKTIAIQTPTEKLVLERSDIESMRTSPLSLMPEGLLNSLKEAEVRDLIAYLMTPSRP